MARKKLIKILLPSWAFLFVLGLTLPGFCKGSLVSKNLTQQGEKYLQQGDYMRGIHEISKALLVDPGNQQAKEILNKYGIEEGLYGRQKTPLSQVSKLTEEIVSYKQKISALDAEKAEQVKYNEILQEDKQNLEALVQQKEGYAAELKQELQTMRQEIDQQQQLLAQLEKTVQAKQGNIIKLHTDLYNYKGKLVDKIALVDHKEDLIREMQAKVYDLKRQKKTQKIALENEVISLQTENQRFKHKVEQFKKENKKHIFALRDAMRTFKDEQSRVTNRAYLTEHAFKESQRRLAIRNKKISDLERTVEGLKGKILDLQSKMKSDVAELGLSLKSPETAGYNQELLRKQQEFIEDLKEKLDQSRAQISALENQEEDIRPVQLRVLNQDLEGMRASLKQKEASLEERNREYSVLEARLADTRQRLGVVEEMVEEKDALLKDLEQQFTDLMNQFE